MLYFYKIDIEKIKDADTFDVEIDLGFKEYRKETIRLAYVNAYETRKTKGVTDEEKAKGLEAKEFVTKWIEESPILILQSIKSEQGKYGRYLGVIFRHTDNGFESLQDALVDNDYVKSVEPYKNLL